MIDINNNQIKAKKRATLLVMSEKKARSVLCFLCKNIHREDAGGSLMLRLANQF